MSIVTFTNDAILLLQHKRHESAMSLAMTALHATAQREYPALSGKGNVGKRFDKIIRDNFDIITVVGTSGAIYSAPGSQLNLLDPKGGLATLEGILYFSVRCFLTHEAELPPDAFFNEKANYGKFAQGFSVPVALIHAILLTVVGATCNSGGTSQAGLRLLVPGKEISVGECWGQRKKILSILGIAP